MLARLWAVSASAQDEALVNIGTHRLNIVCTGSRRFG